MLMRLGGTLNGSIYTHVRYCEQQTVMFASSGSYCIARKSVLFKKKLKRKTTIDDIIELQFIYMFIHPYNINVVHM